MKDNRNDAELMAKFDKELVALNQKMKEAAKRDLQMFPNNVEQQSHLMVDQMVTYHIERLKLEYKYGL